ncbi:F0F1 ATP synthase subunit delta [Rickettsiella endosymbiont of Aleochara curtula]|uniref:F0F1 ATP synthase subunit delta n=1 Tax=Rickettsiella endosymbiont of Aleochara curtula TaxID=3077936 RepID=UPI00313D4E1A
MAHITSIARPYARAAFACASDKNDVDAWSALLKQTAKIINEKSMQNLLKNPCIDKMVAYECLLEFCKAVMFPFGKNFLKLMAVNQRLLMLPEVERLFERYKAAQTKEIKAYAISAVPLTKMEEQSLVKVLSDRFQGHIKLDHHTNKDLLGGLVVRVGDLVIDDSVRGKLERLRATLVN